MRVSLENQGITLGGYLQARDFVLQFDLLPVTFSPGASTGVYFHHVSGIPEEIRLDVFPSEQRWTFGYNGAQDAQIFDSETTQAINAVNWLTVLVVSRGEDVALYLNGIPTSYGTDSWTLGDAVMLFADAPSGSLTVEFDNVLFWDLASVSGLP
jgi:hypothetical protein